MTDRLIKIGFGVIFLVALFLFYNDIKVARENNRNINEEIFIFFRTIEQHCMQYSKMEMPKKCELVLKMEKRCSDVRSDCSAKEYYEALWHYGFDLPPYYKER